MKARKLQLKGKYIDSYRRRNANTGEMEVVYRYQIIGKRSHIRRYIRAAKKLNIRVFYTKIDGKSFPMFFSTIYKNESRRGSEISFDLITRF